MSKQPTLFPPVIWPVARAPYQGSSITTRETSRSGSDRVTAEHSGKAAQLLDLFRTRGPLTMNECSDLLKLPLASVCSLRWCIAEELEEFDTVTIPWATGKTTQRTRWKAKR